jgi:hypothetical protein
MVKAQQTMGLPTWKQVMAIVDNWETVAGQYGFTDQSQASEYVRELLEKMTKFVRYHTQNSSLFADQYFKNYDPATGLTSPEPSFSTFCTSNIGIAETLTVTGGGGRLSVKDKAGQTVTVNATNATANMLARDITIAASKYDGYNTIESSAFVTVHGIDTPLCYNTNGKY